MKRNLKRFSCLLLAVVLSVMMVAYAAPQAAAASTSVYLYDTSTVEQWNLWVENNFIIDFPGVSSNQFAFWRVVDRCFVVSDVGALDSKGALQQRANNWNNHMNYSRECWPSLVAYLLLTWSDKGPWAEVAYDANFGVYRLRDRTTGIWLVDSGGRFPYYCESSTGNIEASTRHDTWLPFSTAVSKKQVSVLTKDSLSDLCVTINQTDRTCSVRDTLINDQSFYVIIDPSNNIYANADGVPYVAHYEPTATNNKYDYIIQEGDTLNEGDTIYNDNSTIIEGSTTNYEIVDNSKVIDLTNGTLNYIGEQNLDQFYIDELLYDFSSQSYSADTYNVTYDNDTYNTWNYTWNITYNITNTYVTNIGQTELYKPLELYYALPDGRSSADLTAEEIAGMSFEFADCVNYAKSATDTYLRALYHFDGNTDDSSYFSTQGKFEWVEGASITYMDVGTFDGALYLGPEKHQLKITLPSNIGSGDFTVQFRYYQEGAADTQANIENSLSIGGSTVLQWDEGSLYSKTSTTACASLGVGAWSEIAVVRHSGTTYLYYNGLKIASFADTAAYSGDIVLTLGDTTRASSMLDELRVVNFAVAESGASYTCTSVPYDTNTVLVLPDSAFPIADEYWDITSSATNLLESYKHDTFYGSQGAGNSYMTALSGALVYSNQGYVQFGSMSGSAVTGKAPYFTRFSNYTNLHYSDEGLKITCSGIPTGTYVNYSFVVGETPNYKFNHYLAGNSGPGVVPMAGIFTCVATGSWDQDNWKYETLRHWGSGSRIMSVVTSDGSVNSVNFTIPSSISLGSSMTHAKALSSSGIVASAVSGDYEFGLMRTYSCVGSMGEWAPTYFIFVRPVQGVTPTTSIVYMELAQASSTDLTAEWVTCMYSSEEVKPNTAAIQTDIPINGYTVGGVRPTFPARGDVWMPVSNNRISGVYIYNGSAWEEVNARWYTGTRWIPIYGFDLTTLEDCWDIADIGDVIVPVGTEQEFWNWWKRAWTEFREWLSGNSGGGGSGVSDDTVKDVLPDEDYVPDDPDTDDDEGSEGYSFFDLAKELVSGVWRTVKGFVRTSVDGLTGVVTSVTYISDFFSFYDDDGEMHGIVNYGGDDIWD